VNEIVPGVLHWKALHPNGLEVSSYYLVEERTLIDPMEPPDGLDALREPGEPRRIVLSNRHHWRDSGKFVDAFGCTVHASQPGLHEFSDDQPVEPFDFGAELAGGVETIEVDVICPDETALFIPSHSALSVADGLINYAGLGFFPDQYIGDDPEAVKRGLRESYAELLALEFENLLVAHGNPIVGGAKDALREFVRATK
jgi:glyoxylase-like metal-dependent hydrolase (beta-lactamase superfamily II)